MLIFKQKTHAHRKFIDNVKQDVKLERLQEMVSAFRTEVEQLNIALVGSKQLVLVEGVSLTLFF
jgi:tRNA A37 methylthiotransferase MiaB